MQYWGCSARETLFKTTWNEVIARQKLLSQGTCGRTLAVSVVRHQEQCFHGKGGQALGQAAQGSWWSCCPWKRSKKLLDMALKSLVGTVVLRQRLNLTSLEVFSKLNDYEYIIFRRFCQKKYQAISLSVKFSSTEIASWFKHHSRKSHNVLEFLYFLKTVW